MDFNNNENYSYQNEPEGAVEDDEIQEEGGGDQQQQQQQYGSPQLSQSYYSASPTRPLPVSAQPSHLSFHSRYPSNSSQNSGESNQGGGGGGGRHQLEMSERKLVEEDETDSLERAIHEAKMALKKKELEDLKKKMKGEAASSPGSPSSATEMNASKDGDEIKLLQQAKLEMENAIKEAANLKAKQEEMDRQAKFFKEQQDEIERLKEQAILQKEAYILDAQAKQMEAEMKARRIEEAHQLAQQEKQYQLGYEQAQLRIIEEKKMNEMRAAKMREQEETDRKARLVETNRLKAQQIQEEADAHKKLMKSSYLFPYFPKFSGFRKVITCLFWIIVFAIGIAFTFCLNFTQLIEINGYVINLECGFLLLSIVSLYRFSLMGNPDSYNRLGKVSYRIGCLCVLSLVALQITVLVTDISNFFPSFFIAIPTSPNNTYISPILSSQLGSTSTTSSTNDVASSSTWFATTTAATPTYVVSTYSGTGTQGSTNGVGTVSTYKLPDGLTFDSSGNMYLADRGNSLIRKITPAGISSIIAGTGSQGAVNGIGTSASFNFPSGVAFDATTNSLFVCDTSNYLIRKISLSTLGVTTFAGSSGSLGSSNGAGTAASFNFMQGIAVDSLGNVYVADTGNYLIRKITPAGVVSTLAGTAGVMGTTNGAGSSSTFSVPSGIAVDSNFNVYVGDDGSIIRKITSAGVTSTFLGIAGTHGNNTGSAASATFASPQGITIDISGNLYITDYAGTLIRKYTASTGLISNVAGIYQSAAGVVNGLGSAAKFYQPRGIIVDSSSNIFVGDLGNNVIRQISPSRTYTVATYAGNGVSGYLNSGLTSSQFAGPGNIVFDSSGNMLVSDNVNNLIRKISTGGLVSTFATGFNAPFAMVYDSSGNLYVCDSGNNVIKKVTPAGVVSVFAGSGVSGSASGTLTAASFNSPFSIAIDSSGNLYVGEFTTKIYAGSGSTGTANGALRSATFSNPASLAFDIAGNLYISDNANHLIRKITTSTGQVTTLAGSGSPGFADGVGTAAQFFNPGAMVFDADGSLLVTDWYNERVRKIVVSTGVVTTIIGSGTAGTTSGVGTAASLFHPCGINFDSNSNMFISDCGGYDIRKVTIT